MFFGVISCRSGSGTCWRRQRLRSAIATARLAASCPTMCLSSSETISSGVMCDDIGWLARRLNETLRFELMAAELYRAAESQPLAPGMRSTPWNWSRRSASLMMGSIASGGRNFERFAHPLEVHHASIRAGVRCGNASHGACAQMPPKADQSVYFIEPKDGATVTSPFKVVFGVKGMAVEPAGDIKAEFRAPPPVDQP